VTVEPRKRVRDEDDLDPSLPPLDGAVDDGDGERAADDADDIDVPADEGDPFDDATSESDPVDELDVAEEASWVDGVEADASGPAAGDESIEIADLAGGASLLEDNDALGVGEEDFGLGGDEAERAPDAGEEGPADDDEELREDDLPALDADEDGEVGAETLFDPMTVDDEPPLPWDRSPWEEVGSPVQVGPVRAIACAGQGVVATLEGGVVVRVDLEGGVIPAEGAPDAPPVDRAALAAAEQAIADRARAPVDVTAAVGGGGAVFATIYSRSEGRSWLVRVQGEDVALVAEVAGPQHHAPDEDPGDAEVRAIAWDATRGVVWVAGSFGVVAFAPR